MVLDIQDKDVIVVGSGPGGATVAKGKLRDILYSPCQLNNLIKVYQTVKLIHRVKKHFSCVFYESASYSPVGELLA